MNKDSFPFKTISLPITNYIWFTFSFILVLLFIIISCFANSDLTSGSFTLFMDERIIFDGIENILHPDGFKNFLWSIFDGDDHRYGRILWNFTAVFSFIPEAIFGESGQIFASRMAQVIFLTLAFILLTVTFVNHWALRFILLASLFAMPFTNYYMTMPKPEPLQMLFIAVFLYFFNKNSMQLGRIYWIYLGLAFGTKISALPLIIIIIISASLKYILKHDIEDLFYQIINTIGYLLLGLSIGVPVLFPNLLLSVIVYKILDKLIFYKITNYRLLFRIVAIAIVAVLNIFIAFKLYKNDIITGLAQWGGSTFLKTGHGADNISIGFSDWAHYFIYDGMQVPVLFSLLLLGVGSILTLALFIKELHLIKNERLSKSFILVVIVICGLILNLSIFISVQRIWGFYLFNGSVLTLVGLFSIIEYFITINRVKTNKHIIQAKKPEYYLSFLGLFLMVIMTFIWWLPHSFEHYNGLANRTKNESYIKEYQSYDQITNFLSDYSQQENKRLRVSFDPRLFVPRSNNLYQITEFWGPFTNWGSSPDVVVFSPNLKNRIYEPITPGSVQYQDRLLERDGYKKHVISSDNPCYNSNCYRRVIELENGGEILIRDSS